MQSLQPIHAIIAARSCLCKDKDVDFIIMICIPSAGVYIPNSHTNINSFLANYTYEHMYNHIATLVCSYKYLPAMATNVGLLQSFLGVQQE